MVTVPQGYDLGVGSKCGAEGSVEPQSGLFPAGDDLNHEGDVLEF